MARLISARLATEREKNGITEGRANTMKMANIEIKNFRGIKHACVFFPLDFRIICLFAPGDSGKSTLLTAIEWAL